MGEPVRYGEGDMKQHYGQRVRTMGKLIVEAGQVNGPAVHVVDMEKAYRPDGQDLNPANPFLANLRAPLVFVDPAGGWWWCGVRPMTQCRFGADMKRNGYATVKGRRRKFSETLIQTIRGEMIAWVCDESAKAILAAGTFPLPLPLDTRDDALKWQAAGFSLDLHPDSWRPRLGWKGPDSAPAAHNVLVRFAKLIKGEEAPPFPAAYRSRIISPDPVETVERQATWADVARELVANREALADVRRIMEKTGDDVRRLSSRLDTVERRAADTVGKREVQRLRADMESLAGQVENLAALV